MAFMPCLRCGSRFKGEAMNAYFTVFWGDEREAYRFVGCQGCLDELATWWRSSGLYRDEADDWALPDPGSSPEPKLRPSEPLESPRSRSRGGRARRGS